MRLGQLPLYDEFASPVQTGEHLNSYLFRVSPFPDPNALSRIQHRLSQHSAQDAHRFADPPEPAIAEGWEFMLPFGIRSNPFKWALQREQREDRQTFLMEPVYTWHHPIEPGSVWHAQQVCR